jgi:hypothetical protein
MSNEEVKEAVIEEMKEKIEESKGNINKELVDVVKEESKKLDDDPEMIEAKKAAEAASYGLSAEEWAEHQKSIKEFKAETEPEEEDIPEEVETDPRGFLDRALGKFASRKLLVWSVATVALFYTKVPADQWVTLSAAYVGSQAFVDVFKVIKSIK